MKYYTLVKINELQLLTSTQMSLKKKKNVDWKKSLCAPKTYTRIFIPALFRIAQNCEQFKYSLMPSDPADGSLLLEASLASKVPLSWFFWSSSKLPRHSSSPRASQHREYPLLSHWTLSLFHIHFLREFIQSHNYTPFINLWFQVLPISSPDLSPELHTWISTAFLILHLNV